MDEEQTAFLRRFEEQAASLRRLSCLVSRYIHLGEHLLKCRDLMPQADPTLIQVNRAIAVAHQEMRSFEVALGNLIDDSMILHEDLRFARETMRRRASFAASFAARGDDA